MGDLAGRQAGRQAGPAWEHVSGGKPGGPTLEGWRCAAVAAARPARLPLSPWQLPCARVQPSAWMHAVLAATCDRQGWPDGPTVICCRGSCVDDGPTWPGVGGRAPTCAHAPFVRQQHHLPCIPSASACCTPDPPALPLPAQPPCCSPTGPCYPPCLMASMLPAAHPAADPLLGSEASPTCMLALLSTCLDLPSTHPAADPLLSAADRQGRAAGAPAPAAATPAGGAGAAAAGWQWRRRRRRRRQRHHKPLSCCG